MPINPYLVFNGNTREALTFYTEVFQEEMPEIMEFGPGPGPDGQPYPPEHQTLILHAQLIVHGTRLMFSDAMPQNPVTFGQNITLALHLADVELLHETFARLAEGGKIIMPIQKTFWSEAYGIVEDAFGVQWQVNHETSMG
ncbi:MULTISPECIES: VOC family protein [Exiguobacterium]|uniref:VOC family protein n=1 Tax=Exiguobacterium TaxID=33986 RepID=UPI000451BC39|nr:MULTISPECIES: VOC family protein [unclassified Exiguobacterium]EZP59226.1 3-demethylubiquinone-9 3-methyltransferase [Exiguobacterium sp. RIT341]MDT0173994.1 VOC family protein [Exiguobacterium sp. BRG2]HBF59458.1 VOC family protein [Exiguobacterium sp.]HCV54045.1 VOC family protein [Exiguobacterium sp.]